MGTSPILGEDYLLVFLGGPTPPLQNAIQKRVNNLSTTMFGLGLPAQTKYALQRILRFCHLDGAPATRDLSHSVEMTRSAVFAPPYYVVILVILVILVTVINKKRRVLLQVSPFGTRLFIKSGDDLLSHKVGTTSTIPAADSHAKYGRSSYRVGRG